MVMVVVDLQKPTGRPPTERATARLSQAGITSFPRIIKVGRRDGHITCFVTLSEKFSLKLKLIWGNFDLRLSNGELPTRLITVLPCLQGFSTRKWSFSVQ